MSAAGRGAIARLFWAVAGAVVFAAACVPENETGRYTDIIFWSGIYYQPPYASTGRPLTDDDLGTEQFRVKNTVVQTRTPLSDRDASYVPAGEPVFAVQGYDTHFRLAARHDGGLFLYESAPYPEARHGSDLIDIEGRVLSIAVHAGPDEKAGVAKRIEDPSLVAALVHAISAAPVDLSGRWGTSDSKGRFVMLTFELADGTRTVRGYNGGRGVFADVIHVDESFRSTIDEIMRSSTCAPSCWP